MDKKRASALILENLTSIYGFAFARLYDKDKVDDLAGEIVTEILGSAEKIRDDGAFWAYAWRVADNTFKKFIRRESIIARAEAQMPDGADDFGIYVPAPSFEEEISEREEQDEEICRLRRELSLLSKTHREVSVMYYVKNMSCSEIAKAKNISIEMVKYHLFKTRKLLKDGNKFFANFPVFEKSAYDKLIEMLRPISEYVSNLMKEIASSAAAILADHAPASVRDQCADMATIHHTLDVMAILMEDLVASGKISVPDGNDAVTTWGWRA